MKRVRLAAVAGTLALTALTVALFAFPAGAETSDESRTVTVTGSGSVKAAPDRAEWSFGVQTQAATAGEALRQNAAAMQKLVAALKSAGIPAADLQTEQVSIFPQTDENAKVVGFTATNSVRAVVKDLAKAGSIVDAAAEAGANQIFGPTLSVSDSEDLYEQALEQAYDQARAKAERLAGKAGVSLGVVVSIVEGGGAAPMPIADAAKAEGGDGVPIEPGQTEIQGIVTVTFAIA